MKILSLLLICISTILTGQGDQISISITDEKNEPIAYADGILVSDRDTTYHSIIDGQLLLTIEKATTYSITIYCLGYKTFTQQLSSPSNKTISISLTPDIEALDAVTISSTKSNLRFKDGNLKVNVQGTIYAQQPTTVELMAMLPGVILNAQRDGFTLVGRGSPLIYVGYRQITYEEFLAIPPQNIASITINNNPSARFAATGQAVIEVTLLSNLADGYRGSFTNTILKNNTWNNYLGGQGSLRRDKLEIQAGINYNILNTWEANNSIISSEKQELGFDLKVLSEGYRPQLTGNLGMHYQLNEGDYISSGISFRRHTTDNTNYINSLTSQSSSTSFTKIKSPGDELRYFATANLNYLNTINSKNSIFLGVQVSTYLRDDYQENFNVSQPEQQELLEIRDQSFENNIVSGQLDYTYNFDENSELEVGGNSFNAQAIALQDISSQPDLPFHYEYNENNLSLYASFNSQFRKFRYTIGLRSESFMAVGTFKNVSEPVVSRSQTNFFPRVSLNYSFTPDQTISINLSSTIARPNYLNASSIRTFITPLIEYQRNPNLAPSIAQFLTGTYSYKRHQLNVTAYRRANAVQQNAFYDDQSGRIIQGPENFDLERGINVRLTSTFTYKKWTGTFMNQYSYNELSDPIATTIPVVPYGYFFQSHRFALANNWTITLNGFLLTKRASGITERNLLSNVGANIAKNWKSWTFTINADDIFNYYNFREESLLNGIAVNSLYFGNRQSVGLTVSYRFGKQFDSQFQNEDVDDNLDRMN